MTASLVGARPQPQTLAAAMDGGAAVAGSGGGGIAESGGGGDAGHDREEAQMETAVEVQAINSGAQHGQEDHVSEGAQNMGRELPLDKLPEDIFDHLYSFMPLQDAARAACVSRGFLRSWRRYPRLIFDNQTLGLTKLKLRLDKEALALEETQSRADKIENHFVSTIDRVLKNHSGFEVKVLILQLFPCPNIDASYLDKWLKIAVKPGIRELALELSYKAEYNFPTSLLSDEIGGATVQSLRLSSCAFRPTETLGCNKSLTSLSLYMVRITGEELGQFVSNCHALMRLSILNCNDIICFKAPCPLQQLDHLRVTNCEMLQVIEISAPKLSSFVYGENLIRISLGAEVKDISMLGCRQPNMICRSRTELPAFMPAVERLTIVSEGEMVKTPVMPSKFLHLKYLDIFILESLFRYDYLSLVSFLDASPTLETFILRVERCDELCPDSILGDVDKDQLHLRQITDCRHDKLKNVTITGFGSSKSMIELTSHIVQTASTLMCMTLDTARGCGRRNGKTDRCSRMSKDSLMEAQKALEAVRRWIEGNVPSSANFKVLAPCCKCGW
ncbi:hypothetical protein ACP70R_005939 [Stipagrostis hirtigluma subsp. patula]